MEVDCEERKAYPNSDRGTHARPIKVMRANQSCFCFGADASRYIHQYTTNSAEDHKEKNNDVGLACTRDSKVR